MKIVATVEARMGSSRLPGKVLLPLGGMPVLSRLVERVRRSRYVDEVVIATSTAPRDEEIVEFCRDHSIQAYQGSEDDVLGRVLAAAESHGADLICELMGDSPLIDPLVIDQAIVAHLLSGSDYTSNFYPETLYPMGFAVQVFSVDLLREVDSRTLDPVDRAHVTCFIYQRPEEYSINPIHPCEEHQAPELRLSLDESPDFEVITAVFEGLHSSNEHFGCGDIIRFLRAHPEIASLNQSVRKKELSEG